MKPYYGMNSKLPKDSHVALQKRGKDYTNLFVAVCIFFFVSCFLQIILSKMVRMHGLRALVETTQSKRIRSGDYVASAN